ncbi:30S ribosomal protein S20 [Acetomicrobium hydrogeniformans]|uniref:Small ribosomal subunit protein bS20 n=1 Tax=Acetomicrobium hydrogeniformans TaxID=649746 RepID=A0A7V6ZG17_9BACT|nr:30S ribosomal protein S20 [Acetomicrobium hydrogeniformans]HHZ05096.1 30S ribosomal protein S20 [Acetomicrobium hydrogeniformans]
MPSTKSALRRMRITERNRTYNRAWKARTKTMTKKVMQAVEENDLNSAVKLFDEAQSVIDKAVVKGVIHKNTAAHRKARLAKLIANLKKTAGAESPSQETV